MLNCFDTVSARRHETPWSRTVLSLYALQFKELPRRPGTALVRNEMCRYQVAMEGTKGRRR